MRTLVNEPVTSSLDSAAAGAAGVSASKAAELAAVATDAEAFAGARRGELLAVALGGGGASGARVADADMGAMDGFGCSAGPCESNPPTLRSWPHRRAATVMLMVLEIFEGFRPHTRTVCVAVRWSS